MISLITGGQLTIKMSRVHLPFHTPVKYGPMRWKIVDDETGEVIDKYTPPRKKRSKPDTKWEGSWAQTMKGEQYENSNQ